MGVDVTRPMFDAWHHFERGFTDLVLDSIEHAVIGLLAVVNDWEVSRAGQKGEAVADGAAADLFRGLAAIHGAGSSPHILLVDDDDLFRELLGLNLIDQGYQVTSFDNGADALAYLRRRQRRRDPPRLAHAAIYRHRGSAPHARAGHHHPGHFRNGIVRRHLRRGSSCCRRG